MMKNTAILLGALLLSAAAAPTYAQSTATDEGRPHLNSGPSRELSRLCNSEARDKQVKGAEKRRFMRDCMANRVSAGEMQSAGSSGQAGATSSGASTAGGASATSAGNPPAAQPDAEGRKQSTGPTSRFSKKPVTGARPSSGADTDPDGRARR